ASRRCIRFNEILRAPDIVPMSAGVMCFEACPLGEHGQSPVLDHPHCHIDIGSRHDGSRHFDSEPVLVAKKWGDHEQRTNKLTASISLNANTVTLPTAVAVKNNWRASIS